MKCYELGEILEAIGILYLNDKEKEKLLSYINTYFKSISQMSQKIEKQNKDQK